MIYQYVKCPTFIRKDAFGAVQSIQCKTCGAVIADTIDRVKGYEMTKGGQLVKVVQRQLTRFANYREIKIAFENPRYFHVTHGCSDCMSMTLTPPQLIELFVADQEESSDGYTERERAQVPVGVVVLQEDQSGIA